VAVAVLDASAVVALVRKEKGHGVIQQVVEAGALVASTGLAEALIVCRRLGHNRTSADLAADLTALGLEVEPVTDEDAIEMDYLTRVSDEAKAENPKIGALSLGDVACLAVARRLDLKVVASDGTWELLDLDVDVLPFR
jgi:ribonuclease VapC